MMRRIMIAAGLALSSALLVGGCQLVGGGNDAKGTKTANGTSAQRAQSAATTSPRPNTPAVSKSVTLPVPGSPGQTFTVGFAGLQNKGQLTTLTLVWTPHMSGSDQYSINDMLGEGDSLSGAGTISMIDTANLKRYVVVEDSDHNSLSPNAVEVGTANNQPLAAQYTFATPPGNASLDIYMDAQKIFDAVPMAR